MRRPPPRSIQLTGRTRRGAVLVIVAGLALMLAGLMFVVLVRSAGEAGKSQALVREAQARVMLNAALAYVQETSRLGWGAECNGWTDVRDGSLGPRGPVLPSGSLPPPAWWDATWGSYPPAANFPASVSASTLRWPAPGSAMQGDCFAWERPPHAIELTYAYNPLQPLNTPTTITNLWNAVGYSGGAYGGTPEPGAKANLQPQPIASTWSDFASGERDTAGRPHIASGSSGLGWFRIYRETPADRDNDGVPWYDRVAFSPDMHATFIITCGGGGTYGFRWWTLPSPDDRALEPVTAAESGLFIDQNQFDTLMRLNRILWFRVAWCGSVGGNWHPAMYFSRVEYSKDMFLNQRRNRNNSGAVENIHSPHLQGDNAINQVGTISWIQRLDREPPRW